MRATEEELRAAMQFSIQELKRARDSLFHAKENFGSNRADKAIDELRKILGRE